jgi:hypothetical protein
MIVNAIAKTSSVIPVIMTVGEMMRPNVSLCTSLTELLARVEMKSFQ